ncbi:MAG: HlyD family efflux transporter periplasmic adaptor subunit [Candidatus Latescibacteria bacterium]|nr:HlyD family efflux transporter periplasmic adaptor subunit [Candidatus Latescibacterota bacterium]
MDRPLDRGFRRRKLARQGLLAVLALGLLAALLVYLPGWIKPSFDKERIRTAKVEVGPVEATITASGTVVPEFEQLLSSPISSRVVRILERPGALLRIGQPIIELDLSQVTLAVEKLGEEMALKENQRTRLKLDLDRRLRELDTRWRIKRLEVQNLQVRDQQYKQLQASGVVAKDDARQARIAAERAAIELAQVEGEKKDEEASTQAQIEGLALEVKILQRDQEEARRRLEQAQIRADQEGVLTWVIPQEGAAVGQGEVVARMADLSSFRVEATISEVHAGRVAIGLPVKVKVDETTYLRGTVSRVLPTIENGVVNLVVELEEPSHRSLRPSKRVEVYIVLEERLKAMRLQKGPALSGGGIGEVPVFVVRGGFAYRTPIRLGITSFDYCEVLEGLMEGDEVVISEVKDYIHMDNVAIK